MNQEIERTVKLVPFSGKQEDWRKWSWKFLARAAIKKYEGILLGETQVPRFDAEFDDDNEENDAALCTKLDLVD